MHDAHETESSVIVPLCLRRPGVQPVPRYSAAVAGGSVDRHGGGLRGARTALGAAVRSAATDDEKAAVRTVRQGFETWVTAVQMEFTDYRAGRHALAVAATVGPNRELRKTYGDSRWLAPRGTFVLEHWGKRHLLDCRPGGPRRRSSAAIQRLFSPELRLDDAEATDFAAPLPSGANGARHGVQLPSAVRPDRTTIAVIAYCRRRPSAPAPMQAQ